ncbi:protein of unknown function [Bradyrhizobium sp. ORS 285]|nr:protein of unknown function [Bradyrhizobium sp. ORS 285]
MSGTTAVGVVKTVGWAKRPPGGRLRAHRAATSSDAMVGTAREIVRRATQVRRRAFAHPTAASLGHLPFHSLKQHGTRHRVLAAHHARALAMSSSLANMQGRGECRVKASPMARLQKDKQAAVTTGSAEHPAFPARCLHAYTRSPRCAGS